MTLEFDDLPIEALLLQNAPCPIAVCAYCGTRPLAPFLRGQIQSWWRMLLGFDYCAVVCSVCKKVNGYERG